MYFKCHRSTRFGYNEKIVCLYFVCLNVSCNIEAASITAPLESNASLVDRERLVGGGPVIFTCEYEGIPTPMVRWYHNGEPIQPDSGVSVNGNQVVISEPQVNNSGMYQCMVSNTIDGVMMEDMRQWVLEVREPSK